MEAISSREDYELIQRSLETAVDTKVVELGSGAIDKVVDVFEQCFGDATAVIVADQNTLEAAGNRVLDQFRSRGHRVIDPVLIPGKEPGAKYPLVTDLADELRKNQTIAVAVGSGTVNDITKLASDQVGRKYMVVGTAASMDGYTAFGASITRNGFKITIGCAAPTALVADTDIYARAPGGLNASGYADLLAKVPAGADWLLADAVGLEELKPLPWSLIQDRLREWVGNPEGIRSADPAATESLMVGLVMAGLSMQAAVSSRPASGAEHQFSHLWDMQGHEHEGRMPYHGFKVGLGTLTSAAMYEFCLNNSLFEVDIDSLCRDWPSPEEQVKRIRSLHEANGIAPSVWSEVAPKFVDGEAIKARLLNLRDLWPDLSTSLKQQLMPPAELKEMLHLAGAPTEPESLGISRKRLQASMELAHSIRSRYTVHDLLYETGQRQHAESAIFGVNGFWAPANG